MKVEVPFGPPDYNYAIRGPELPYTFFHNPFLHQLLESQSTMLRM